MLERPFLQYRAFPGLKNRTTTKSWEASNLMPTTCLMKCIQEAFFSQTVSAAQHESMLILEIVKEILSQPRLIFPSSTVDYVGLDWRLKELITSHLCLDTDDVKFVGIHGMGGIGKATLAKVVFHQLSAHFEGSCFLTNVRDIFSKGDLVSLQKQLVSDILKDSDFPISNIHIGVDIIRSFLCYQKILVIFDDVDHIEQLSKLAGDRSWFGLGSKILITTRDKHVLVAHGVHKIYNVECLNNDDALELFSLKAFKTGNPPHEYLELCQDVVRYADGLPLTLEILIFFLCGRSEDEWIGALESFQDECICIDENIPSELFFAPKIFLSRSATKWFFAD
ncbi:disease resistance protein Roq1-like [Rutidosis leptorrhynchoides]|uniref:disease resistance protein Roq1-like n=1 Tax=Rutidosis leptorrhynchoides TaxID=125765 RepID=UPI003A9A0840